MSTPRIRARTRFVFRETITSETNGIRLSTGATVTIPAADYWMARAGVLTGETVTDVFFFDTLASRFAVAGFAITVAAQASTESSPGAARIKITAASGSSWGIDWDHADTTLDPRLLGWPTGTTGTTTSDSAGVLRAPRSYRGAWISRTVHSAGRPTRDQPIRRVDREEPDEDRVWESDPVTMGRYDLRLMSWRLVPSAAVYGGHAHDPNRALAAGVATGDDHQSWQDAWERLGDNDPALLCHDHEVGDGLVTPTGRWERVKRATNRGFDRFDNMVRPGAIHDTWDIGPLLLYVEEGEHVY